MRPVFQISGGTMALCLIASVAAFSQSVPVSENLWRLVAQEDTDGDQKITILDRTTQFLVRDQNNAIAKTPTNFYQMSVLMFVSTAR